MDRKQKQRKEVSRRTPGPALRPQNPSGTRGHPAQHRAPAEKRRSQRARARKRHRKLKAFYLLLLVTVFSAAVALSVTVLFRIDTVEVRGSSRYSLEEILETSGIVTGENLFLAKTKEAEVQLEKQLPYIGQAEVSRRFPAKIVIRVEEAKPIGGTAIGASYALITAEGKSLELVKELPQGCTELRGLNLASAQPGDTIVYEDNASKELFGQMLQAISNSGLDKVTKIDISDPYSVLAVYDGRISMALGTSNDLDFKMRFGARILTGEKQDGEKYIEEDEFGILKLSTVKEDNRAYFDPEDAPSVEIPNPESASENPEASSASGDISAGSQG